MRYTEYHAGKAVIKDRSLLAEAMAKLAKLEDAEGKGFSGQWIPCSERLPERDGAYQLKEFAVTINDGGRVYASHASYDFEAHKWIYHNGKIVAWMPLPKPYKEGKDE